MANLYSLTQAMESTSYRSVSTVFSHISAKVLHYSMYMYRSGSFSGTSQQAKLWRSQYLLVSCHILSFSVCLGRQCSGALHICTGDFSADDADELDGLQVQSNSLEVTIIETAPPNILSKFWPELNRPETNSCQRSQTNQSLSNSADMQCSVPKKLYNSGCWPYSMSKLLQSSMDNLLT